MNTKETILKAIEEPMKRYYEDMTTVLGNWQPLERAAGELLEGRDVHDDETGSVSPDAADDAADCEGNQGVGLGLG